MNVYECVCVVHRLPSIAVPRGKDSKELPVGLQVIGAVDYQGAGGCGSALLRCARVLGRV